MAEAKRTHFRYRRLTAYLYNKYHLVFSEHTIRAILKRNHVVRQTRKTKSGSVRHLYDYEHLPPFTEFQLDTKHLLDQHALPSDVYDHMMERGLPCYEWRLMEMATRSRFTAYSYTLSATFGFLFLTLVLLWLRTHNVRSLIRIQLDNGSEFLSGSKKKLAEWNSRLACFNALLDPIPPGQSHLQGVIENAHRADDEYFLMVHAERCDHTYAFLNRAQRWQDTWNFHRPSFGIAMHGKTPREKLLSSHALIHEHVLLYPVVLMEDMFQMTGPPGLLLEEHRGGKYVHTTCQIDGERQIPLDALFTGKSDVPFTIKHDEILSHILIAVKNTRGGYLKIRVRDSMDYPLVGAAISLVNGKGCVAVGAIGAKPRRFDFSENEAGWGDRIAREVSDSMMPVANTMLSPAYRKKVAGILVKRIARKLSVEDR